jgi:gliding motility-associated protein GldL
MKSISLFFETKTGKYVKNLIIGVGASVVLIGALAKIQHWEFAGPALTAGMLTEAFIFLLLGILPPHKDYYWERFYPNITENPQVEAYKKGIKFTPQNLSAGGAGGGVGPQHTARPAARLVIPSYEIVRPPAEPPCSLDEG